MSAVAESMATRAPTVDVNKYYANLYASSCGSQGCECPCTGGTGPCVPGCNCVSSRASSEDSGAHHRRVNSFYPPTSYSPPSSFKSSGARYSDFLGERTVRGPSLQHISCSCLPPLSPLRPLLAGPSTNSQSSIPSAALLPPTYTSPPCHSSDSGVLPPIAGLMESLSRSPSHEESPFPSSSARLENPSPDRHQQDDSERDVKPNFNPYVDNRSESLEPSDSNYQLSSMKQHYNIPSVKQQNTDGRLPSIMEPKLFSCFRPHLRGVV